MAAGCSAADHYPACPVYASLGRCEGTVRQSVCEFTSIFRSAAVSNELWRVSSDPT